MSAKTKSGRMVAGSNSSGVGLLLLDASRKAIYSNAEAVRVVAYPKRPRSKSALDDLLGENMYLLLTNAGNSPLYAPCLEFVSGRRHYLCRVFPVSSSTEGLPDATVVVFERNAQPFIP